jgi:hypothetical protein
MNRKGRRVTQRFYTLVFFAKLCVLCGCIFYSSVSGFLAPDDITLEKAVDGNAAETDLFLKYQSHQGDYLIFYDIEGSTLLLRYRIDRWDYDNDVLRDSLRQGITYRVRSKALKKLAEGEVPKGVMGSGVPLVPVKRKIRRIRDLYSADFVNVNESALRDLRY